MKRISKCDIKKGMYLRVVDMVDEGMWEGVVITKLKPSRNIIGLLRVILHKKDRKCISKTPNRFHHRINILKTDRLYELNDADKDRIMVEEL